MAARLVLGSEVMSMATFTRRLYVEFRWSIHSFVVHSACRVLRWLSLGGAVKPLVRLANWLHEVTVPMTMAELADEDEGAFSLPRKLKLPAGCPTQKPERVSRAS
jgi:hypothetical protein